MEQSDRKKESFHRVSGLRTFVKLQGSDGEPKFPTRTDGIDAPSIKVIRVIK